MNCAASGHANPERAKFCLECGDRALASSRQVEEVSRALGEAPVLVAFTRIAYGHAHLAAGRAADAIEAARAALDVFGRAEKERAGESATLLAEALLEAGLQQ